MRIRSLLLTAVLVSASSPASAATISALHVFGDSLSDNGNLSAIVDGSVPGPGPTIPADPYALGRASNGPLAVEYLAQALGLAPLLPAALGGTNFAVIGAATGVVPLDGGGFADNASALLGVTLPVPTAISTGQLAQFFLTHPGPIDPDALFFIWGGANDLLLNPDPLVAVAAASNISAVIQTLYGAGARQFLVPNLPDLGLTPDSGPLDSVLTGVFNTTLAQQLALLGALPGMQLTQFNTFDLFNAMVANPALYGLTNVEDGCVQGNVVSAVRVCSPADEGGYLFWDGTHPTTAVHQMLGGAYFEALDQQVPAPVPEPASLTLLGLGLAGMGARRWRQRKRA